MPLSVAIQMDHVRSLNIAGDTTFALSLEAQRRGHRLYHYTPDRLTQADGRVFARLEEMQVRDVKGDHFTLGEPVRTDLSELDVVLLRQDPPFDMNGILARALDLSDFHEKRARFAQENGSGHVRRGIGIATSVVNYLVYSAALWLVPALPPLAALAVGSAAALAFSFFGYSRLVFDR